MKVWIDGDLCTGVALCEQTCPDVFTMGDDGVAHVMSADRVVWPHRTAVAFPTTLLDSVIEAAEDCPEECIFIEQ